MTRVVLHIGNMKCASTFLQNEVFPRIKDVNFMTPDLDNIVLPGNIKDDKLNVVSRENDFGSPNFMSFSVARERMLWLRSVCGDAKIILVVRERTSWVNSIYNQYVKNGGAYNFQKWWTKVFDINFLDYDRNIAFLRSLFSDVFIIDFEMLKKDHSLFVKKICDFIGCDVPIYENKVYGRSLPGWFTFVLRNSNRFLKLGHLYRYFNVKLYKRRMNDIKEE